MFIVTTNEQTADKMKRAGFRLVSNYPGRWTFVHSGEKYDKDEYPDSKLTHIMPM